MMYKKLGMRQGRGNFNTLVHSNGAGHLASQHNCLTSMYAPYLQAVGTVFYLQLVSHAASHVLKRGSSARNGDRWALNI